MNFIAPSVPIGLLVGSGLSFIWLTTLSVPSSSLIDAYHFAVLAMPLSVWIELLSEPMYIYGQLNAFVKLRVLIDGCTQTARTFVLVLVAYLTQSDSQTLYAFAIVYVFTAIFYSFAYAIYFAYHFKTQTHSLSISSFLPTFDHFKVMQAQRFKFHLINQIFLKQNVNMWRLLNLCWSFFKQTVLKQFLTEGERFVMTFLSLLPLDQQGLFHVVGNVGALAARFVFAPVEEASFLHFSQLLHRSDSKNELLKSTAATAARTLQLLLRGMTLVGMFGLAFGIPFASTVLGAYGGIKLVTDDAVKLLRFQCAYIALIALNGILETFTFASMSNRQLARFNYALIAFSLLFLVSSGPLVRLLSLPGFVVASCMPMIGRIMFGYV